ncbi:MAG TPA: hypothetical protein VIM30_00465 [Candidatus Limnocylindrales bacterium]
MRLLGSNVERAVRLLVLAFLVEQPAHRLRVAPELRVGLFRLGVGDPFVELVGLQGDYR